MSEREKPVLPTREIPYQNKSYLVETDIGHAILTYRFPREITTEGYDLHMFGNGYNSPPFIKTSLNLEQDSPAICYFDRFITNLDQLYVKSGHPPGAFVEITWPGMTKVQVKADKKNQYDYSVATQHLAMSSILYHINQNTPNKPGSIYVHGYSMGARTMTSAFTEQYGTSTSIMHDWLQNGVHKNPRDVCLILHMPAFNLNEDFSSKAEWKVMIDAIRRAQKVAPWAVSALGDAAVEIAFKKIIKKGKIHNDGFYNKDLYRHVIDPRTAGIHLMDLLSPYEGIARIQNIVKSGIGVYLITAENDGLISSTAVQPYIDFLGSERCHSLSKSATHTAHLNPESDTEFMNKMSQIIAMHNQR